MQQILLNLVAAAPPPQTGSSSANQTSSAKDAGPSFDSFLTARMREHSESDRDDPAADPAQMQQAQNAAAAAAAQQAQPNSPPQQPAQSDPATGNVAAVASDVAALDEQAAAQTAVQAAINAVMQELVDGSAAAADPTQTEFASQLQNSMSAKTTPVVPAATDLSAEIAPPEAAAPAVQTTATMAAPGSQQTLAVDTSKNDPIPTTEDLVKELDSSAQKSNAAADAAWKTDAQTKPTADAQSQAKSVEEIRGAIAAKPTEKVKADESLPNMAALSGAKSAVTVYENKSIDPARLAEGHPLTLTQQVGEGIESMTRTGQNSLRLQLNPPDLGRIDLRLTSSSDGVRVSITADAAATGRLLERNLDDLKTALSNAGVSVLGLSVGQGTTQQQNANAFSDAREGPVFAASAIPSADGKEADVATSAPGRGLSSSNIDYRI
jgi:flagellar hook-length control protein FliK